MTDTPSEKPEPRYKASDVCRMAGVQPYVLRYWESEFPALAAERGLPGPRTYSARDVKVIERIKKLLHDEGYTIAGAKKKLDGEMKGGLLQAVPPGLSRPASAPSMPALQPPPLPPSVARPTRELELDVPEAPPPASAPADSEAETFPRLIPALPSERPRRGRRVVVPEVAPPAVPVEEPASLFAPEVVGAAPAAEAPPAPVDVRVKTQPVVEPYVPEPARPVESAPAGSGGAMPAEPPTAPVAAVAPFQEAEPVAAVMEAPPAPAPPSLASAHLTLAIAELREILALLSRDEP